MTGHAILTPMLMALLLITGDFLTMSLTTDRTTPSPTPDSWRVRPITAAAAILGLCGLTFAVGMVAGGKYLLGFDIAELRTLAFITLVFAGHATIYVVRERRHMWRSRPGSWLVVSSLLDLGVAGALAISGTLMAPLSALTVATVLAGAMVFSIVLDAVKQVAFKSLKIV